MTTFTFNEKEFNSNVNIIRKSGQRFDNHVQRAIMGCVAQVVQHGDFTSIPTLLDAMGRSTRKQAVVNYLLHLLTSEKDNDGKSFRYLSITKNSEEKGGYKVEYVKYKGKAELQKAREDAITELFGQRVQACQWFEFEKAKKATVEKTFFEKAETKVKGLDKSLKESVELLTFEEKAQLKAKLEEMTALLSAVQLAEAA